MATFKEIRGQLIKKYTTNPADPLEGQMWYNNTTGTLKGVVVTEAWSSGNPTINEQKQSYGTGIQTAALLWAGRGQPPNPVLAVTEEYNGSGWSAGGTQTAARASGGGAGTQTASLMIGGTSAPGANLTTVEEYNGTGWSASPALNGAKFLNGTFGTSTAAVTTGGSSAPQVFEVWNNVSWTNGPAPTGPSTRYGEAGSGTETAGLISGGFGGGTGMNNSDEYNGTSFSSSTTLNTARGYMGAFGLQTATVVVGGFNPPAYSAATELYDGATWTTSPATIATASGYGGAAGTSTAGVTAGFLTPTGPNSTTTNTEEYNKSASVITAGAWATGGNMNTTRSQNAGFGASTDAAISAGGYVYPGGAYQSAVESYDGATWTSVNSMPVTLGFRVGAGTQAAGLAFGGHDNTSPLSTSEWDGTNWTAGGDLNNSAFGGGGCGSQTAAWVAGTATSQPNPAPQTRTEEYNGASWATAPGTLNNGRAYATGTGPQTDATLAGGDGPGVYTEKYDGTSWTNSSALPLVTGRSAMPGGTTPSNSTLLAGGTPLGGGVQATDGTSWFTYPSLATTRGTASGAGAGSSASSGMVGGGSSPASTNQTEEFTEETSAANIVTVTTS